MRVITLDIETIGEFVGGLADPTVLEVCLVGVHDSKTGEMTSYLKEDLPQLWSLLERADVIVGYNSDHFDLPILNKYYPGNLLALKSVDLMKEVRLVLGRRLKLDNLAEATLGKKKSGDGKESMRWWAQGEVEKVREYCLNDVRITRELYDYALKNKALKYRDFDGVRDIKLDTSSWKVVSETPALTHTLPF
ncbi:ribonuclease H-like domain-containing protein [Candidatus Parcubacteria bacterium]|nr:ribonuclease H-like domain-containing protein [Candidatus Parcubacteria bacterium]